MSPLDDNPLDSMTATITPWLAPDLTRPFIKGRVALHAILKGLDLKPGDEVLVPGFTCVVVPAAIIYSGGRPVFYDIAPDTYNGDPHKAVAAMTERTRAVIVQHTLGYPAEIRPILEACSAQGIPVIEDCAHAVGPTLAGQPVGTLGGAAFTSFQWAKPVTTGLGGMALVNDPDLRFRVFKLWDSEYDEPSRMKLYQIEILRRMHAAMLRPSLYWPAIKMYRGLSRMGLVPGSSTTDELTDIQMPTDYMQTFGQRRSGTLDKALAQLTNAIGHRINIAGLYRDELASLGIAPPRVPAESTPIPLRIPLLVKDRATVLARAERMRIEIGEWFNHPLHPDPPDPANFGYRMGSCPIGEAVSGHIINLPTHPRIGRHEVARTLDFLSGIRSEILSGID